MDFLLGGQLRVTQATLVDAAFGKVAHRKADAAHVERFQRDGLEALADHELGRTAADIHDQLLLVRIGQGVRNAHVDQPRLFASGDDFDREAQRGFRLHQEVRRVLGHAQGVGGHGPHRFERIVANALVEAAQRADTAKLGRSIEHSVRGQAGGKTHGLLDAIEGINLVINDSPDLQAKTVGTQINGGDQLTSHGCGGKGAGWRRSREF